MTDPGPKLAAARDAALNIVAACSELQNWAHSTSRSATSRSLEDIGRLIHVWVMRLGEELDAGRPRIEAVCDRLPLAIPHRAAMTVGPVSGTSAHSAALKLGSLLRTTAWQAAHGHQRARTEAMLEQGVEPEPCYGRPEAIEQGWSVIIGALRGFSAFDADRLKADIEEEYLRACAHAAGTVPTAPPQPEAPAPPEFVPLPEDMTILTVLAMAGYALLNANIVRDAGGILMAKRKAGQKTSLIPVSETTLRYRLPRLLSAGLVARPPGADGKPTTRKGVAITDKGRDLVKRAAG
jgi:hypothetical protein